MPTKLPKKQLPTPTPPPPTPPPPTPPPPTPPPRGPQERLVFTLMQWAWGLALARMFLMDYATSQLVGVVLIGCVAFLVYAATIAGFSDVCWETTGKCRAMMALDILVARGPAMAPCFALLMRLALTFVR